MNSPTPLQPRPNWWLAGLSLAVLAGAALLGGCRGNTTAAAPPEHHAGKPPTLEAMRVSKEIRSANPLSAEVWKAAHWTEFQPSLNINRTTPLTRCAILFDDQNLYLGIISRDQAGSLSDSICFYLDTTASGHELLEFRMEGDKATCSWMRSVAPAQPLEDGTPDLGFPVVVQPNYLVRGLWSANFEGYDGEAPARALVLGVPLASLPVPMNIAPASARSWKVNAIRTIMVPRGDGASQRLESDLSPIYSGAQAVSPYRMAELKFH
jgi:hypothetical protein